MQDKIILNEAKRVRELHGFEILDTPAEQAFEDIVKLASEICETPMALINLVDSERQWTKSSVGIEAGNVPRTQAFCSHTILHPDDIFTIENATEDERFVENPFVTGEPHIKFYAGAPLVTEGGDAVGALCVIDQKPRELTEFQQRALRVLARQVVAQMELRRTIRQMREAQMRQRKAQRDLREGEARFQTFMDNSPAAAYMKDEDGRIVYANKTLERMFNLEEGKMLGKTDFEIIPEASAVAVRKNDALVLSEWKTMELLEEAATPDGAANYWLSLKFPLLDSQGRKFLGGVSIDITARVDAEEKLNESEKRYRHLFELSPGYINVHDLDGVITAVNEAAANALGYRAEEMVGKNLADFFIPKSRPFFADYLQRMRNTPFEEGVFHVLTKNGERRVWQYRNRLCKTADESGYVIGYAQDITELKETQDKLHDLTLTDDLTTLYNRRGFFTLADQALRYARRKNKECIAIYADLDNLKQVNDKFGHAAGSQMIADAANIFKTFFRDSDIAARLGGDEFIILVQDSSREAEKIIMERLQKEIAKLNETGSRPFQLSISFGIARFEPESGKTIEQLVSEADKLMYAQKQSKKVPLKKRLNEPYRNEDSEN